MKINTYNDILSNAINGFSENLDCISTTEDFNKVIEHLEDLINSVMCLIRSGFYTQAMFMGITFLEEAVKLEVCFYRNTGNKSKPETMSNHFTKHKIATNSDLLFIGSRLKETIGINLATILINKLKNGQIKLIREDCLYFKSTKNKVSIPSDEIKTKETLAFILLTIEIANDKFAYMTNRCFPFCNKLDQYSNEVFDLYSCTP
ncbi:MAG: AbiV family abortive infection protein [Tannerellaceae bacterium]